MRHRGHIRLWCYRRPTIKRYENSDNIEVMKAALRMAYESSRYSVCVDMLSSYANHPSPELFYYSQEEIFSFAKTLTCRVVCATTTGLLNIVFNCFMKPADIFHKHSCCARH